MFQVLNTFSLKKYISTTGTSILTLGSAFYVDEQLMLLFKVKNDHRSKFSNLSNWKEEA